MGKAIIHKVTPRAAVSGGEVIIECENLSLVSGVMPKVFFNNSAASTIVSASPRRVIAVVPPFHEPVKGDAEVKTFSDGDYSDSYRIIAGEMLADDLHIVANPALDPTGDFLIVTRSGSRGQQLPVTLFRLHLSGELEEISGDVMNPTGIAYDRSGQLFVTSRAEGTVYRITGADEAIPFASDLGIATGLAFDRQGNMFVGDRSGTIYKINPIGETETFATLEQSIAAYHLAFGPDNALYVTRPNVASYDSIMRIDEYGEVSTYYRGLGRPQGLAFDRAGNLYVAACLNQRRGIIRIAPGGENAELIVSGPNFVGLCFGKNGEMFAATNEAVFRLQMGIYGLLSD